MSYSKKEELKVKGICRDCDITQERYPGYGYRCRKFPKCGYPIHPGGCRCGCGKP